MIDFSALVGLEQHEAAARLLRDGVPCRIVDYDGRGRREREYDGVRRVVRARQNEDGTAELVICEFKTPDSQG